MRIPVEIAPYARALRIDKDNWINLTVLFPLLDMYRVEDEIYEFDLLAFIKRFKNKPVYLIANWCKYLAVRLHWYDYNQSIRIAYPEYSQPLIILVLQVYMAYDKIEELETSKLFITY